MIRLEFSIDLHYEVIGASSDFVFVLQAARNASQSIVSEQLSFNQMLRPETHTDYDNCGMRILRVRAAPGPFDLHYDAIVDINHHLASPRDINEVPVSSLPIDVLTYLYPSRYAPSDRLLGLATREFGHLPPGYARVEAIQDWVKCHVRFSPGSSNCTTSALDTLVDKAGVCRDFSHLMIALCRALNIPARFVTGIDYGADPSLGAPDFHAYVEVYLGHRWYLFDPSGISPPMGLVRIGTGRDAADVSFATIFGTVKPALPAVKIRAIESPALGLTLPQHSPHAISSYAPV